MFSAIKLNLDSLNHFYNSILFAFNTFFEFYRLNIAGLQLFPSVYYIFLLFLWSCLKYFITEIRILLYFNLSYK